MGEVDGAVEGIDDPPAARVYVLPLLLSEDRVVGVVRCDDPADGLFAEAIDLGDDVGVGRLGAEREGASLERSMDASGGVGGEIRDVEGRESVGRFGGAVLMGGHPSMVPRLARSSSGRSVSRMRRACRSKVRKLTVQLVKALTRFWCPGR